MTLLPDVLSAAPSAGRESAEGLPLPEAWRAARVVQESLRELGSPWVNMLFVGADEVVWRVLATSLNFASPVASWRPGEPMHLPENGAARTLVIRDVGFMTGAEQVRLLDWLERTAGRTQVVCTTRAPLIGLVDTGGFIGSLYYRLNTICLDLGAEM